MMLNNTESPLAEEEPPCSLVKKNESQTLRTSLTSVASITSSASQAADDDLWNFDLDDILNSMPESPVRATASVDVDTAEDKTSFLPSNLSSSPPKKTAVRIPRVQRVHSNSSTRSPAHSIMRDDSSRSLSSSSSRRRALASDRRPVQRSVSFDKVKIREFQQVLGEHPCRSDGPSIALGWDYHEKKETNVDKFESKRTSVFSMRRRSGDFSALSPDKREKLARKLGYTESEIQKNVKQAQKVQKQRKKTRDEVLREEAMAAQQYDPMAIMMQARKAHGRSS